MEKRIVWRSAAAAPFFICILILTALSTVSLRAAQGQGNILFGDFTRMREAQEGTQLTTAGRA